MMTTRETARALGVREQAIHRHMKKSGARWRQTRDRLTGSYLFSNDDVLALAAHFKVRHFGHLVRTLTPNSYVDERTHASGV